ncbi:MAG: GbsR/MarR family transcriptional regulator [Acidiferrobacterales bacterium]
MKLTPVMEKYVLHWGEMGSRWGVNRTVAQIHALLYLSPGPLNAEEIAKTLSVARSNVSTSLKELLAWDLVKVVHIMGDRRDHFECVKSRWDMLLLIMDGRKRREIDPVLKTLRECVRECEEDQETEPEIKAHMTELLEFLEVLTGWFEQMKRMPRPTIKRLIKMGASIQHFVRRED